MALSYAVAGLPTARRRREAGSWVSLAADCIQNWPWSSFSFYAKGETGLLVVDPVD